MGWGGDFFGLHFILHKSRRKPEGLGGGCKVHSTLPLVRRKFQHHMSQNFSNFVEINNTKKSRLVNIKAKQLMTNLKYFNRSTYVSFQWNHPSYMNKLPLSSAGFSKGCSNFSTVTWVFWCSTGCGVCGIFFLAFLSYGVRKRKEKLCSVLQTRNDYEYVA